MKIFNTLVCTIDDLRLVVQDYLSEGLSNAQFSNCTRDCGTCSVNNNTLAIDVINEFKLNLSDFVRDFKPAPQKIKICGYVKDIDGEVIENTEVSVKDEPTHSNTTFDGFFDLFVYNPKGKVLIFSKEGYISEEVQLNTESRISVTLYNVSKDNTCDKVNDMKESEKVYKNNFLINSPRQVRYDLPASGSLISNQEDAYIGICELYTEYNADIIPNIKLGNLLSKYLGIPCLDIKCAKSNDIKINKNGQLIAAKPIAISKTKIKLCRITAENDVRVYLSYDDDGVMTELQSKSLRKGEHVYVTGLDFDTMDKYMFCEILDIPRKRNDIELVLPDVNSSSIGSIMHIRSTTSNTTPVLKFNDVVSAAILTNGDVLWIDANGRLKNTSGKLANKIKPHLTSKTDRLIYVKAFDEFVLTLSEEGTVRIVNCITLRSLEVIENVYSARFIRNGAEVILEVRRFEVEQTDSFCLSANY